MKWEFNKKATAKESNYDISFSCGRRKSGLFNRMYISNSGVKKIGENTESVCIGIDGQDVVLTTRKVGTVFILTNVAKSAARQVGCKDMVKSVISALTGKKTFKEESITCNLEEIREASEVWRIVLINDDKKKWEW